MYYGGNFKHFSVKLIILFLSDFMSENWIFKNNNSKVISLYFPSQKILFFEILLGNVNISEK